MALDHVHVGKDEVVFIVALTIVAGSAIVSWLGGTVNPTVVTAATGLLMAPIVRKAEKRHREEPNDD